MSVKNEDIYKLLCNVHQDIGELKGVTAATNAVLKEHIEEDKRIVRAMYDTQIAPMLTKVEDLRVAQARQRGATKVWGLVATAAASVVGGAVSLIKWH
jgi:hypothetical protein